jgi:hypothetical protein
MTDDITLKEFEALIEKAYWLKKEKEEYEAKAEKVGEELEGIKTQLLAFMEEFDKTSYKSKFGTIIAAKKLSVKTPKDPESKAAFFAWLDSKGIKDQLLTVNSKTLNSLYEAEFEAAKEAGADNFSIPGIEAPTVYTQLQMRK